MLSHHHDATLIAAYLPPKCEARRHGIYMRAGADVDQMKTLEFVQLIPYAVHVCSVLAWLCASVGQPLPMHQYTCHVKFAKLVLTIAGFSLGHTVRLGIVE